MVDQFKEAFKEETTDIIASIENLLVDLEANSTDEENKILLFRHLHTIKGGAGMFGYVKIADLVHEVETVLDPYKQGEADISAEVITNLFVCMDYIKFLMDCDEQNVGDFQEKKESLIGDLRNAFEGKKTSSAPKKESVASEPAPQESIPISLVEEEAENDFSLYRIDLVLSEDFLFTGNRPHFLLNDLTELGEMRAFADTSRIPFLSDLDTGKFYLRWVILLASLADIELVQDVFLFVMGDSKATVSVLKSGSKVDSVLLKNTLSEITSFGFGLEEVQGLLDNSELLSALVVQTEEENPSLEVEARDISSGNFLEEPLVEASLFPTEETSPPVSPVVNSTPSPVSSAPPVPVKSSPPAQAPANNNGEKGSSIQRIRVDSRRLDNLVDLVGELVTIQARLSQKLKEGSYHEMENIAEKLDFVVQELRDVTTGMRMIPIQGTFTKFQRLVRDLAQELGKKVDYITEGGDTELDKNIIEKLDEPLVHLIRNSLDHGIESPQVRLAAGKPEKAYVKIIAQQNGANITIQIHDDGGGLNRDAIGRKAVERGLVPSYEELPDDEIYNFIFAPGFSTAGKITNLSGRGVGLNVVKTQVESLRGNISVRTELGKGTVFSLIFPLTLAIIDGFLIRVGREFFVIPLVIVEACLEFKTQELESQQRERGGFMSFRDKVLPCLELRQLFEIEQTKPNIQQIVIVRTDSTMIGIVVDEVIGKHQTVIKSLGEVYRNVKGVSSATILGDGSIALLLDVDAIVDLHLIQKREIPSPELLYEEGGTFLD